MTGSERFDRAQELFRAAIKLSPAERREFLAGTRARDGSIADEVESLIAAAASFPDSLETDSRATCTDSPALPPDSQIGAYKVIGLIGAGGMGQVYLARDSTLGRDVALKVLPAAVAANPERRSRFRWEAQALAALRHPHVAVIYGWAEFGDRLAIAMELIEGPTLADRIAKAPLARDEALTIARQIAEALEAAHEQGIVHRDLKPSNVKITSETGVKVLDFGLAKGLKRSGTAAEETAALPDTLEGAILGTPSYMAPEQASGLAVDKRADIFAFGAVLFEMLVGRRSRATPRRMCSPR